MRRLAFLLLLTACGGGLERAAFATDQLTYGPSGRVELSLVNTGATTLGINLCLSTLVSEDGKTSGPRNVETCDLDATLLEPSQRVTVRKQLPSGVTPGNWRYETTIRLPSGSSEKVLTSPFTVSAN
ncbi:MAG TPA: hypothetical protein VGE37_09795 [Archangium sp.]